MLLVIIFLKFDFENDCKAWKLTLFHNDLAYLESRREQATVNIFKINALRKHMSSEYSWLKTNIDILYIIYMQCTLYKSYSLFGIFSPMAASYTKYLWK